MLDLSRSQENSVAPVVSVVPISSETAVTEKGGLPHRADGEIQQGWLNSIRSNSGLLFQVFIILLSALWLTLLAATWGEEADAAEREDSAGEYNFSWLDPDKKVYVLQNRRYTKAGKFLISAMGGVGMSNPYRQTFVVDPRLAYYFSEAFGIEVFHSFLSNSDNATFDALQQASPNAFPVVREITKQYGALLHYAPWYAKINVFNQILYFDWHFTGGAGSLESKLITQATAGGARTSVNQSLFGVFLGTGHQYHLNETFTVRMDFTGAFYQSPAFGNSGSKSWFSNYTFGLGLGLRI